MPRYKHTREKKKSTCTAKPFTVSFMETHGKASVKLFLGLRWVRAHTHTHTRARAHIQGHNANRQQLLLIGGWFARPESYNTWATFWKFGKKPYALATAGDPNHNMLDGIGVTCVIDASKVCLCVLV